MSNKTIAEIKIKLRGDGVFDIYTRDNGLVASHGSIDSTADEVKKLLDFYKGLSK